MPAGARVLAQFGERLAAERHVAQRVVQFHQFE